MVEAACFRLPVRLPARVSGWPFSTWKRALRIAADALSMT